MSNSVMVPRGEIPPAAGAWSVGVPPGDAPPCDVPPVADAVNAEDLRALVAKAAEVERLQAQIVALAGRLAGSGVAEREEGLPLDLVLAAEVGLTGGDRWALLAVADVLGSMPVLAAAFAAGRISWGQTRRVALALRRRSRDDRAAVDAWIDAALDDGRDRLDPDGLCEAVDALLDELAGRRSVEQREARARAANRLWAQQSLDGRVAGGFDLDAEAGATVLNAVAAKRGAPSADDPDRAPEAPTREQRNAAEALVDVCAEWLAGGDGRRARAGFVVDVDVSQLDAAQPGRLRLRLPGPAPRMSARALATAVEHGADVRVVITDGAAPVAVTRPVRTAAAGLDRDRGAELAAAAGITGNAQPGIGMLLTAVEHALAADPALAEAVRHGQRPLCAPGLLDADDICTATRQAVYARDRGCRWFGCTDPVDWTDVHHLVHREHGGDHHPDRLVALCRHHHKLVHDHGWQLRLDPSTGELVARRAGRTLRTLPRSTRPSRPPRSPTSRRANNPARDRPPPRGDPTHPR